jgi:hypothetical protein
MMTQAISSSGTLPSDRPWPITGNVLVGYLLRSLVSAGAAGAAVGTGVRSFSLIL